MAEERIVAAGQRLKEWAFGSSHDEGGVMIGHDRLHVFVFEDWFGETPDEWEGFPVT